MGATDVVYISGIRFESVAYSVIFSPFSFISCINYGDLVIGCLGTQSRTSWRCGGTSPRLAVAVAVVRIRRLELLTMLFENLRRDSLGTYVSAVVQLLSNQLGFCLLVVIPSNQGRVGGAVVLPHSWR